MRLHTSLLARGIRRGWIDDEKSNIRLSSTADEKAEVHTRQKEAVR
jgi:hypothetical protein